MKYRIFPNKAVRDQMFDPSLVYEGHRALLIRNFDEACEKMGRVLPKQVYMFEGGYWLDDITREFIWARANNP